MPKTNCDYSRTVIYKIVCNDLDIIDSYVGQTTNFTKRKSQHKCNCNNQSNKDHNINLYCFIRNNGGWENWSMVEIEKYSCQDGNEARARERYYYKQLHPTLNIQKPNRSNAEWVNDNYLIVLNNNKNYQEKHKEELNIIRKTRHICDCGGKYLYPNKAEHLRSNKHQDYINSLV